MRGKWLTGLAEWMASLGQQRHGWVGGGMGWVGRWQHESERVRE